jgi:hypothetical protein
MCKTYICIYLSIYISLILNLGTNLNHLSTLKRCFFFMFLCETVSDLYQIDSIFDH